MGQGRAASPHLMNILVKAEINGGKTMLSTGAKSPIAPGRGNGVAKPQHCSPRFAALHKFKLMPGPPVLHPVLYAPETKSLTEAAG